MARKTVRCGCGADFPIPEVPPSILHCPKCGEAMRFKRGDGDAGAKVREDIREPIKPLKPANPYYPLILLGVGGLVVAGGLVGLIVYFSGREAPPHPSTMETVRPTKPRYKEPEPILSIREIPVIPEASRTPEEKPAPVVPGPVDVTAPSFDANAALARAQRLASRVNLARVVLTYYFLTNRREEQRDLQARIEPEEAELVKLLAALADRPQGASLKDYFRGGDLLTSFDGQTFDPTRPKPFTDQLREWLSIAQPGATAVATVQRNGKAVLIPLWFPEIPIDIVNRELRPRGILSKEILPLPVDLVAEVRKRVAGLHPFYRKAIPADDAAKLDRLIRDLKGTAEDVDFLRNRILAHCSRAEAEMNSFESRVASLEAAAASSTAVDTVLCKDGRRIQGTIEEDNEDGVRIKGRFGAARIAKAEILKVERGDALGGEFRRRYDAARGKLPELLALLGWCKDKNLSSQRELAAYAVLTADPGNDAAWTALGVADRSVGITGPEFDVLVLKDGTRREGIITEETEQAIQIDVIVRGMKAETIGTGKATILKSEIARIERMNDAARKRATDRALSFGDRAQKTQDALARIVVAPDVFHGMKGHRAAGTLFELHSTCAEPQVRETAMMLEEMFNAYRKHFSVRRNASRKIDVYFMANAGEFGNFQQVTRGSVSASPAYFDPKSNHIAAFYGVQSDEEARIRATIRESEREINEYKKQLAEEEERLKKDFAFQRQVILDEASKAKKGVEDGKLLAAIDRQKQENLNYVKAQERTALDQLAKNRSKANQAIADHEAVIRSNQTVLANQTRVMYEILFHESFHAFAANFLWDDADNAGLPRWLHEGMASYFERSVVEGGHLVHGAVHPTFLRVLRGAQRDSNLVAVGNIVAAGAEMFQVQHDGDIPRQEAAYAHAWGLAHYLLSRGITREQLEAYVADVSAGRNRVQAFEKLAGRRIGEVEAEWRLHLNSLK